MSDQTTPDEQSEVVATESTTADSEDDQEQEQDHDCQQHLEFVDYQWVQSCYDDIYECSVCGDEYRLVYQKAFLLDGDDYSLVEEYTDEIERQLEQHRNHNATEENEGETPSDE